MIPGNSCLKCWFRCCSVIQSCPTLCNPMDCSMPGFPVHYLLELAQTHIHWVSDAIQLSHPLLSPSPPTFNLSQHQGLFQCLGSSHQVAKVLELQPQHQDQSPLGWTGWISLLSKGLSRVFSKTTVQKFQLIRFSLVIYFIHSSVYISTLSPIHPTSSFPLWYT